MLISDWSSDVCSSDLYIGPDIDLGFRISKFARPGCLTVSLDVLEAVRRAANADRATSHVMGREPWNGVLFGRPYPILWMLDAETGFDFHPWEVEADPMMARSEQHTSELPTLISNTYTT